MKLREVVTALLALATAAVLMYFAFWEPPYMRYTNIPFPVHNEPAAGESLVYTVGRCSRLSYPRLYGSAAKLERVDAVQKPIGVTLGVLQVEPGCHDEDSGVVVVPVKTPCGTYIARGYAQIDGTFRRGMHIVPWQTQPFQVRCDVRPIG